MPNGNPQWITHVRAGAAEGLNMCGFRPSISSILPATNRKPSADTQTSMARMNRPSALSRPCGLPDSSDVIRWR